VVDRQRQADWRAAARERRLRDVEALLLDLARADLRPARRGTCTPSAADQERVDAIQELVDDLDLVGDLGAASTATNGFCTFASAGRARRSPSPSGGRPRATSAAAAPRRR
jgi:hypothetical protein